MSTVPELGHHSWPVMASIDGIADHLRTLLGDTVLGFDVPASFDTTIGAPTKMNANTMPTAKNSRIGR